jgi:hypothetical protein
MKCKTFKTGSACDRDALRSMMRFGFALCIGAAAVCSTGAVAQEDSICKLAMGHQARISEIRVRSGGTAYVQVERAGQIYQVTSNCLIQGGDIVRPLRGSTVLVVMPSGETAVAEADHPLPIPVSARPGRAASLLAVLSSFLGEDIGLARAMANVKIAEARALDKASEKMAIAIPGLLGAARQNIVAERPLLLRWSGGAVPYSVKLQAGSPQGSTILVATGPQIELPPLHPGEYSLTISCVGCTSLSVPLRAAPESLLPTTPGVQALLPEDRATAEAAWLLVQGPEEWRLEAISRLNVQARDHGDVIAQAILAPE